MSPQHRPLSVEHLEDRLTPTTWNNPWPDAGHLTLSFAPDGTPVGDRASALFRGLDALAPTPVWQREVLRAIQTWAVHANLNVGVVPDGGAAFGTPGRVQGDARFGDIRVAAYGMSSEVVAVASPFEAAAGTWAGDVKLNVAAGLGVGGAGGRDLYSVLLHEFGHTLGLDHSDDPASPLFESYRGPRGGLTPGDVARIQSLYGPRTPDANDAAGGNDSAADATKMRLRLTAGVFAADAEGDLTTLSDSDYFAFTAPLTLGAVTVRLETLGVSLLAPKLTVYDAARNVVASVAVTGPSAGNLEARVNSLRPLATYYVKVEDATGDVFGIGGYKLKVDSLPGVTGIVGKVGGVAEDAGSLLNVDLHTNDSLLTASLLPQPFAAAGSRFDYAFRGSIGDSWDVDVYKVKAPQAPAGGRTVMTVMAWGLAEGGLHPRATVFDAAGRPVPATVLVNENGSHTIQIPDAVPDASYFVKVEAARSAGAGVTGNYFLGIDYGPQPVALVTYAADAFDAARTQSFRDLTVWRSSLLHFTLTADAGGSAVAAGVRVTIYDEGDNVVFTRVAEAGQTVSGSVVLGPGKYLLRLAAGARDRAVLPPLTAVLAGIVLDDPIGPRPNDTTYSPSGGSDTTAPPPETKSSIRTKSASDPYGSPYTLV